MVNILKERIQIQNHCDKQGKILTKSKRKIYTKTISQKEKKKYKAEIIGYAETQNLVRKGSGRIVDDKGTNLPQ